MREPFLEPLLRSFRLRRVLPYVRRHEQCRLLDIGCGWEARLLQAVEPYITKGVGVDFKAPELFTPKIHTQCLTLHDSLPFADGSFDLVTMLAVLEHLAGKRGRGKLTFLNLPRPLFPLFPLFPIPAPILRGAPGLGQNARAVREWADRHSPP